MQWLFPNYVQNVAKFPNVPKMLKKPALRMRCQAPYFMCKHYLLFYDFCLLSLWLKFMTGQLYRTNSSLIKSFQVRRHLWRTPFQIIFYNNSQNKHSIRHLLCLNKLSYPDLNKYCRSWCDIQEPFTIWI